MNLDLISRGANVPHEINVVIEIAKNDSVKYEIDKASGALFVDRLLPESVKLPQNYGFMPHTLCDDGDALDVIVIMATALDPGCVIACRPIGVMYMEDESGIDAKIIAVPTTAVSRKYAHVKTIANMDQETLREVKHFYSHYKDLDADKWVKIKNDFGDVDAAIVEINESIDMFVAKTPTKTKTKTSSVATIVDADGGVAKKRKIGEVSEVEVAEN
jgi:inorganic pyrophosphatase